jgi:hypothetical protein
LAVALSVAGAGPAAAAATPSASGTVFVHSARSGELGGGRLTLRGVGRLVTWSQPSGRSGVLSITRMHRLLFGSGNPAIGTLHVAGQRGGDELTFTLSNPRFAHGTVSSGQTAQPRPPARAPGAGGPERTAVRGRIAIDRRRHYRTHGDHRHVFLRLQQLRFVASEHVLGGGVGLGSEAEGFVDR